MAEQLKDLIEKIQQEGIRAAEEKAKEIRKEAVQKAAEIIEKATVESHKIVSNAKAESSQIEQNTRAVLIQAARDMLLGLRKEILAMLDKLIVADTRQAFSPEDFTRVLTAIIKDTCCQSDAGIIVSFKKETLENLGKHFLQKLKEETKREIALKPSDDISGGFIISFDGGKSHFDFTDKALAEYLGTYLKPALNQLLKEAT